MGGKKLCTRKNHALEVNFNSEYKNFKNLTLQKGKIVQLYNRQKVMYYYFAQFHPDEEHPEIYNVSFPDLPGCFTFGSGLNEAMTQAMDALTGYLEVEMERGEKIPSPSDMETAKARAEAENRDLGIPPQEGILYLLVPADPKPEPFVRLNISMQPRLVAMIDRRAKECGMTRSGLLAAAAREYMARDSAL